MHIAFGMPGIPELLILAVLAMLFIIPIVVVVLFVVILPRGTKQKANPNLRPCPDCKSAVSIHAASCPKCGRPTEV